MKQTLECIAPHLYRCTYQISTGEWSTRFYGIFTDWQGKRRKKPLGADLKIARKTLDRLMGENAIEKDFDAVKPEGMIIGEWADSYFDLAEVKTKRSLNRDRQHVAHIKRHLGSKLLADLGREDLFRYKNERSEEYIIRNDKPASKKVSDSTIKLELSCLRRMVNLAGQKGLKVSGLSFRGVLPTVKGRERIMSERETKRLFAACPLWLKRLGEASLETCLSEGDLIRLTDDMIDEDQGVIVPDGGRCKTEVAQMAPLTERFREIVAEIHQERKRSKVKNIGGLVFTREDGRAINKDMITGTLKRICKKASVKDFRFHDFRHCAKTAWARRGIGVEAAMLAAGHASPQMHQHYIHLQRSDVAKAFGICSNSVQTDFLQKSANDATN
jgi:integrase